MENRAYSQQQVTEMRHRFKSGDSLNNLEIERLLWTAEWAMGELEHQLQQPVVTKEGGGEQRTGAEFNVLDAAAGKPAWHDRAKEGGGE